MAGEKKAKRMISEGKRAGEERAKYRGLLRDEDVKRWYENLARGSQVTADVYLRRLGKFCSDHRMSPRALVSMPEKELKNLLADFVSKCERKGLAGSYVKSVLKALRSWLDYNDREVKLKIKIKGADDTPTLREERVPTQDELRRIFFSADERVRAACALLAHAGLRLEVLGNYTGDDGLRIGDLLELVLGSRSVHFKHMPAMIVVRRELSKAGRQYYTFLSEEGCGYLLEYLNRRLKEGEKLSPDSPVITSKFSTLRSRFVTTTKIADAIRRVMRKAGFPWRPYVLRSYFDTQLMLAESRGLVIRDYRQCWMGHKGDTEARYTTAKGRLTPKVIEEMRESYSRAQEFLQTIEVTPTRETLREEFRKQLLLAAGFTPEQIGRMNLASMNDEEFKAKIKGRLAATLMNGGANQRIVREDELDLYLAKGWKFVARLSASRVIVELPV